MASTPDRREGLAEIILSIRALYPDWPADMVAEEAKSIWHVRARKVAARP